MSEERTDERTNERTDRRGGRVPEAGPVEVRADTATPAPVALAGMLVAVLLAVALVLAFVPRTVAEGGRGDEAWRLRVAPGILSPVIRFDGPDGSRTVPSSGAASLEQTTFWHTPSAGTVQTIVVGPTPRAARSIRVTSEERGVGEAVIERVLWRRVHVAVLDEPVTVTDLVAIGGEGQVVDVVADVPLVPEPSPGTESPSPTDGAAA